MSDNILIISLINTTLLLCFKKWGWLDWYEAMRNTKWMPKGECYLCLGFWLSMIETWAFLLTDIKHLLIPFCSAAIINFLVNSALVHDHSKNQ